MGVTAVGFNFDTKTIEPIEPETITKAPESGFVWIDVESHDVAELRESVTALGLVSEEVLEEMTSEDEATQLARYEEYLHITVCGCHLSPESVLELRRADIVVGEHFMLTAHVGPRAFLDRVKREYVADFKRHAKTPSFLVFEVWDHLADHYVDTQKRIETEVESLQSALLTGSDDDVFEEVAAIGADLLRFRAALIPARAMLTELATRRSIFINEATQGFLANIVGTLERVLQDVLADRDSLNQALNLYMSMVSHRTNQAMSKLTVISVIFLPLTFLCGVYGMNFNVLPELRWEFGYAMFWGLVLVIVVTLVAIMRRSKLL